MCRHKSLIFGQRHPDLQKPHKAQSLQLRQKHTSLDKFGFPSIKV
jgi:hypothetical protein